MHQIRRAASRWLHSWNNGGRYKWLGGFLAASLLFTAGAIAYVRLQPGPYDPLEDYPLVEVIAPVEAVPFDDPNGTVPVQLNLPTIRWGGGTEPPRIEIRGTVCNGTTDRVSVISSVSWTRLDREAPATFDGGQASGTRLPGCVTITYTLVPPALALDLIRNLADEGITQTRWELQGTDLPIDPDGDPGVEQPFTSQTFVIEWTGGP